MPTPAELLGQAAHALKPLLGELVFVGGATVGLLLTDPAAEEPRPTLDVDLVTPASSRVAFQNLEDRLYKLGFSPDTTGPICRYVKGTLIVDVMADDPDIQGFTNPWYASAIHTAEPHVLPSGLSINVMNAPHLIATKLVAWATRGQNSMFHHDLEDIFTVVDGRPELADELRRAPPALQAFVATEVTALLAHPDIDDTVLGFCRDDARADIVLGRMRRLAKP